VDTHFWGLLLEIILIDIVLSSIMQWSLLWRAKFVRRQTKKAVLIGTIGALSLRVV
jgi:predicted tellurium resistance membrane protein TerC